MIDPNNYTNHIFFKFLNAVSPNILQLQTKSGEGLVMPLADLTCNDSYKSNDQQSSSHKSPW